jgi:predicted transcriptional regulator
MSTKERVIKEMIVNQKDRFNVSFPSQIAQRLSISPSYACKIMRELMREGFCGQGYNHGPYHVVTHEDCVQGYIEMEIGRRYD